MEQFIKETSTYIKDLVERICEEIFDWHIGLESKWWFHLCTWLVFLLIPGLTLVGFVLSYLGKAQTITHWGFFMALGRWGHGIYVFETSLAILLGSLIAIASILGWIYVSHSKLSAADKKAWIRIFRLAVFIFVVCPLLGSVIQYLAIPNKDILDNNAGLLNWGWTIFTDIANLGYIGILVTLSMVTYFFIRKWAYEREYGIPYDDEEEAAPATPPVQDPGD